MLFATMSLLRKNISSNANDEWPEMIEEWPVNGKVGESITVKTKTQPSSPKTIDLKNMSAEDLKSIKKQDPFLYYSIPGVRSAMFLSTDIDTSDLGASKTKSCPSRLQTTRGKARSSRTTTRSSCISFECHPDLMMEDLLSDLSLEDEELSVVSDLSMGDCQQDDQECCRGYREDILDIVQSSNIAPRRISHG